MTLDGPIEHGAIAWKTPCEACGVADTSSFRSKFCLGCRRKAYYQANRLRIIEKAQEYRKRPGVRERNLELEKPRRRSPGDRFIKAKAKAKEKNVVWSLTKQTYFALIKLECFYCQGYFQKQADQTGIGLDRIDNNKGYEPGNVLPACGACNVTRQNRWTVEQTKAMIDAVVEYNKLNNITAKPNACLANQENEPK